MSKIIPMWAVYLFFIGCILIAAIMIVGISLLPIDTKVVCGPLIKKAVERCVCP